MRLLLLFQTFLSISDTTDREQLPRASLIKDSLYVEEIVISGNRRTKPHIILRELDFRAGEKIDNTSLPERILKAKNRIFNTRLFNRADISVDVRADTVSFLIDVNERWYMYPSPIFEVGDRNFNEWWRDRDKDWHRLDYGLRFTQRNFRGRNEQLKAVFQLGFNEKIELFYSIPYIDRAMKTGMGLALSFSRNKQIAFRTNAHKLDFFAGDEYIRKRFYAALSFTRRAGFYTFHTFEAAFHRHEIADTVAELNPEYFLEGQTLQRYFRLNYRLVHDRRDIAFYPLKGSLFSLEAEKLGPGIFGDIDQWNFTSGYSKFVDLHDKFYLATSFKGKISFPVRQAYYNTRGLGYGKDFIRGFELYVIDGQHYVLMKNTFRREIFKTERKLLGLRQFRRLPIAVYAKAYFDAGYVADRSYNPLNRRLANTVLWGSGVGLDIVTFYDLVFRLEYSVNSVWEKGFFINLKAEI